MSPTCPQTNMCQLQVDFPPHPTSKICHLSVYHFQDEAVSYVVNVSVQAPVHASSTFLLVKTPIKRTLFIFCFQSIRLAEMVRPSARRDGDRNDVGGRYKGVRMRKWGSWVAEVRQPNSRDRIWLGSYGKPEEAARAYDAAVLCLRGSSAILNFPSTPPDIPNAADLSPPEIQVAASKHARKAPEECEGPELKTPVQPEQSAAGPVPNELKFSMLFGESSDMHGYSEWTF